MDKALSNRYIPYITSIGSCPTATFSITNTGACPTVTYPISQVQDPVLSVIPNYHKNWSLVYQNTHQYWTLYYSYLPNITSTGPYPTGTIPLLQGLDTVQPVHPLYHKYWSLPDENAPISQVLDPVLPLPNNITITGSCPTGASLISQGLTPDQPVHSLNYKYWTLSGSNLLYITLVYRFIPYIANTGYCPTVIFPILQVLDPVLQSPLLCQLLWSSLLYRYIPYITSYSHCPTFTSSISQVLKNV